MLHKIYGDGDFRQKNWIDKSSAAGFEWIPAIFSGFWMPRKP